MPNNAAKRSRDEIVEAIRALTDVDCGRLNLLARWYVKRAGGCGLLHITPDDLLQEAFLRALEGRNCPVHVDVVTFLNGIMRSTMSSELEKIRHRPRPVVLSEGEDPPDVTLTPEEYILEKERESKKFMTPHIFSMIGRSPVLSMMVLSITSVQKRCANERALEKRLTKARSN